MSGACAVVTVSDRVAQGLAEDSGGALVAKLLTAAGFEVVERQQVADSQREIRELLLELSQRYRLVVTTGGTGIGARDVTPEATLAVIERRLQGMEQAMQAAGLLQTPLAMLSRAVAGTRGGCLILNLPGSPDGVRDGLGAVLPALHHACRLLARELSDCKPERERHARGSSRG